MSISLLRVEVSRVQVTMTSRRKEVKFCIMTAIIVYANYYYRTSDIWKGKTVQVSNDQEKTQLERNSHSKKRVGKTKLTFRYLYLENTS